MMNALEHSYPPLLFHFRICISSCSEVRRPNFAHTQRSHAHLPSYLSTPIHYAPPDYQDASGLLSNCSSGLKQQYIIQTYCLLRQAITIRLCKAFIFNGLVVMISACQSHDYKRGRPGVSTLMHKSHTRHTLTL
jgi:hypothetical protein